MEKRQITHKMSSTRIGSEAIVVQIFGQLFFFKICTSRQDGKFRHKPREIFLPKNYVVVSCFKLLYNVKTKKNHFETATVITYNSKCGFDLVTSTKMCVLMFFISVPGKKGAMKFYLSALVHFQMYG